MKLLLLLVLGALALGAASEAWARRSARRGAREILETNRALYSGTHDFVGVDPSRFGWLDLRFYDRLRSVLEQQGFRFLGDVEDVTVTQQTPSLRTFLRAMAGDHGRVIAGFYQVRARGATALLQWLGILPRRLEVLDLESELADGRWIATSNTEAIDTTPVPDAVDLLRLPLATPPEVVLERHRERLERALASRPDVAVRRVASLSEVLVAQDRLQLLRNPQMLDREALVETIEGQAGSRQAKDVLIAEVRRAELS